MPHQFRHQPVVITAAVTFAAVAASVVATRATMWWAGYEIGVLPVMLACLIPVIMVPIAVFPLASANQRLRRTRVELELIAHTDALTGLPNRRAFFEQAERMLESPQAAKGPVAAVMIDVDRFKAVNDAHGHAAGDGVLRAVGSAVRDAVMDARPVEWTIARIGGEEFAVLARGLGPTDMVQLADRICHAARRLRHDGGFATTVSVGVALRIGSASIDTLLSSADNAVHVARQAGGDRWSLAATERQPGPDSPLRSRKRKKPPEHPAAQGVGLGGQDQAQ